MKLNFQFLLLVHLWEQQSDPDNQRQLSGTTQQEKEIGALSFKLVLLRALGVLIGAPRRCCASAGGL